MSLYPLDISVGYLLCGLTNVGVDIVGIRYYHGIATYGENLLLKRELSNQYDRNAIQVNNVANIQVGQYPSYDV